MNIFVLDKSPTIAAQYLCDQHITKMCLETAQILSTVLYKRGILSSDLYKPTHINHPCTLWTAQTFGNLNWLYNHGIEIGREYTKRYGKVHKSVDVICAAADLAYRVIESAYWFDGSTTPPAMAMPIECKHCTNRTADWEDVVISYRRYYNLKQLTMKRFTYTNATKPSWIKCMSDVSESLVNNL